MTPRIDYYMESHKYNKSQFNLSGKELQMEFWLDIIELFYSAGDSVYNIFNGSKTMHEANLSSPINFCHLSHSLVVCMFTSGSSTFGMNMSL